MTEVKLATWDDYDDAWWLCRAWWTDLKEDDMNDRRILLVLLARGFEPNLDHLGERPIAIPKAAEDRLAALLKEHLAAEGEKNSPE